MRELPRGTVTFVFNDIEGSTRLLASLGSGWAEQGWAATGPTFNVTDGRAGCRSGVTSWSSGWRYERADVPLWPPPDTGELDAPR